MEHKIIKQEKNPFLEREELVLEIQNEVAPSFEEVKKLVGKDEELIVIKKVNGNFGRRLFTAEVVVYDNIEARKNVEVIPKKIKKKMAEEAKVAEESAKKAEEAKSAEETAPAKESTKEEKPTKETKPEEGSV